MKKKIYSIIALSLVGVLLITTIVLSLIKKDFAVDASFSPLSINVYYNGEKENYTSDKAEYGKFIENVKESFKINYLTALFQGKSGVNPKVYERTSNSIPGINADGTYSTATNTYVEFIYNTPQLIRENSKDYNNNGTKTYTSLFLQINNESGLKDVNVYYRNNSSFVYYYTLTMAQQSAVYDYIKTLNF